MIQLVIIKIISESLQDFSLQLGFNLHKTASGYHLHSIQRVSMFWGLRQRSVFLFLPTFREPREHPDGVGRWGLSVWLNEAYRVLSIRSLDVVRCGFVGSKSWLPSFKVQSLSWRLFSFCIDLCSKSASFVWQGLSTLILIEDGRMTSTRVTKRRHCHNHSCQYRIFESSASWPSFLHCSLRFFFRKSQTSSGHTGRAAMLCQCRELQIFKETPEEKKEKKEIIAENKELAD